VDSSLVFDVGMHTGRDTEFYLAKGFNVVAIEANPKLVESARSRFRDALAERRLVLHETAIGDHEGEVDFYVNNLKDDWGTTSKAFALRNEALGTNNTVIRVKCTRFQAILRQHEMPYYLKIDIEGADVLCLEALAGFDEKPKYLSMEAGLNGFDQTFTELSLLWRLGYREFKVVNQGLNERIRCPNPPLEGLFVDYAFDGTCSGPFGEEAPGPWMPIKKALRRCQRVLIEQKYFGALGRLYRTPLRKLYEVLKGAPVGWYDIHAKRPDN